MGFGVCQQQLLCGFWVRSSNIFFQGLGFPSYSFCSGFQHLLLGFRGCPYQLLCRLCLGQPTSSFGVCGFRRSTNISLQGLGFVNSSFFAGLCSSNIFFRVWVFSTIFCLGFQHLLLGFGVCQQQLLCRFWVRSSNILFWGLGFPNYSFCSGFQHLLLGFRGCPYQLLCRLCLGQPTSSFGVCGFRRSTNISLQGLGFVNSSFFAGLGSSNICFRVWAFSTIFCLGFQHLLLGFGVCQQQLLCRFWVRSSNILFQGLGFPNYSFCSGFQHLLLGFRGCPYQLLCRLCLGQPTSSFGVCGFRRSTNISLQGLGFVNSSFFAGLGSSNICFRVWAFSTIFCLGFQHPFRVWGLSTAASLQILGQVKQHPFLGFGVSQLFLLFRV